MLHTKFHESEQSVLRKKIYEYFLSISMVQTHYPLQWGNFGSRGHHLNKFGKGPLASATRPL